jgi:hypothetical protein
VNSLEYLSLSEPSEGDGKVEALEHSPAWKNARGSATVLGFLLARKRVTCCCEKELPWPATVPKPTLHNSISQPSTVVL